VVDAPPVAGAALLALDALDASSAELRLRSAIAGREPHPSALHMNAVAD
jgi:hypothetical protein